MAKSLSATFPACLASSTACSTSGADERTRYPLRSSSSSGDGSSSFEKPLEEGAEAEIDTELPEAREIRLPEAETLQVKLDREIRLDRDESLGQTDLLPILLERAPLRLPGDPLRVGQEFLEGADLRQEAPRPPRPDPGRSRDVVRRVSHEREEVDDLVGRDAEPLGGIRLVDPVGGDAGGSPPARVEEADPGSHELMEVLVSRDDDRLDPGGRRLPGQRSDHVIRLVALELHDLVVEGSDEVPDPGEGGAELVRHPLPRRLVLGKLLVAAAEPRIEDDREVGGIAVVADREEKVQKSPRGRRVLPPRVRQRPLDEGEEGPVDEGVRIDEEEPWPLIRGRSHCRGLAGEQEKGATPAGFGGVAPACLAEALEGDLRLLGLDRVQRVDHLLR